MGGCQQPHGGTIAIRAYHSRDATPSHPKAGMMLERVWRARREHRSCKQLQEGQAVSCKAAYQLGFKGAEHEHRP
eukprot:361927-Chlamydomonas_euryale.AAC.9